MSRSRSTRTPHGGSPTGAIEASTAPVGVVSERVSRAGKPHEVGHQRGGMRRPRPPVAGGKRIRPRGPRASRGPRAAPRPGTRARSAARRPGASTTPIRLPFASSDRLGEHRDRADLADRERVARVAHAVARRLEALAELEVHLRRMQVGADEAALALEVDAAQAAPAASGPSRTVPAEDLRGRRTSRTGPCPSAGGPGGWRRSALVSCCAAAA